LSASTTSSGGYLEEGQRCLGPDGYPDARAEKLMSDEELRSAGSRAKSQLPASYRRICPPGKVFFSRLPLAGWLR